MHNPNELRKLALWYREFAERTENPVIWESRLLMAEDLEAEAKYIEAYNRGSLPRRPEHPAHSRGGDRPLVVACGGWGTV